MTTIANAMNHGRRDLRRERETVSTARDDNPPVARGKRPSLLLAFDHREVGEGDPTLRNEAPAHGES